MTKNAPYEGYLIQRQDTDASKLNLEQIENLIYYYGDHDYSLSYGVPLQELLDLWHASIEWCSFQGWLEERPKEAVAAYNRCITDRSKHLHLEA